MASSSGGRGRFPGNWLGDVGLLGLRLFTGLALALAHGRGKVPPSERFVSGVAELGFPLPALFAWAAALSEFAGGFLLAAGLFTRPAACMILVTMLVAGVVRHAGDPFKDKEKAFLFAAIAFACLGLGGGRLALDHLLRRFRPRGAAPPGGGGLDTPSGRQ
jgi:putative oxidoreductase